MQLGFHLTPIKAERLMRQGLITNPARRENPGFAPGVYVWRDLEWAQWWALACNGQRPRYARLVIVDTAGLAQEHDQAGADWLHAALDEKPFRLGAWAADRIDENVAPERILSVVEIWCKPWPSEDEWQQILSGLSSAANQVA